MMAWAKDVSFTDDVIPRSVAAEMKRICRAMNEMLMGLTIRDRSCPFGDMGRYYIGPAMTSQEAERIVTDGEHLVSNAFTMETRWGQTIIGLVKERDTIQALTDTCEPNSTMANMLRSTKRRIKSMHNSRRVFGDVNLRSEIGGWVAALRNRFRLEPESESEPGARLGDHPAPIKWPSCVPEDWVYGLGETSDAEPDQEDAPIPRPSSAAERAHRRDEEIRMVCEWGSDMHRTHWNMQRRKERGEAVPKWASLEKEQLYEAWVGAVALVLKDACRP